MPNILRASVFFVTAAILTSGVVVEYAVSDVNKTQVEALWKDYIVAEKRLQVDLANLMGNQWPELQSVAGLQRDQQFALVELHNLKFQYLLVYDPDRIVYDEGLSQFADFDWNEADSEALRELNPDFSKLERWAELNSKRLSDHPNVTLVDERIASLQRDERYQSMMDRYQARMNDLESALDLIDRADKRSERTKTLKSHVGQ
jgi:hypothetical protein